MAVEIGTILGFVTVIVATNYALAGFLNVKLFDLLVFIAGFTLGLRRGVVVAATAWLIYGSFNPYGPTTLPLLGVVMVSEMIYAVAGAALRKVVSPQRIHVLPSRTSLLLGALAILCTLVYDGITNIYTGISWAIIAGSTDYLRWVSGALFNPGALFFTAAHISSNVLFFIAFAPLLIMGVEKFRKEV
ncbi:hypothetical protein M1N24_00435 [Dehalococcoidia bacterium]|nr:hypothetical protein [Dehalococcoidia bacterium]